MTDLRGPLENEARRVSADPDALEATRRRSRRMHVQRRVVSGVVALAVAATGVLVAVRSFQGAGSNPRPAQQPAARGLPLWPSLGGGLHADVAAIDALQAQVDQGHQAGYLSPEIVAQMFAMETMEWEREDVEASVRGDNPVQVAIANSSLAGPAGDVRTMLTMERWRGRDDGIYVITALDAEILDLRSPIPGQDIRGQEELRFSGSLQGISQRLLALRLTIYIEGGHSFGSYESFPSEVQSTEEEVPTAPSEDPLKGDLRTGTAEEFPGPDGEFDTTVTVPDVPPAPGASVFVRDRSGAKIAVEAFRLGPLVPLPPPRAVPVPGPTPTSDDATPAAIEISTQDMTGVDNAAPFAASWIQAMGRGVDHGGYEIVAAAPTAVGQTVEITEIRFDAGWEQEAARMERLVFPGAALVPSQDGYPPLAVVIGRDFAREHTEELAAFRVVEQFGEARRRGSGAERFITEEAARHYDEDAEARLYGGYASSPGMSVDITEEGGVPQDEGDTGVELRLHFFNDEGAWTETIRVDKVGGQLKVVEASLGVVVQY